MGNHYHLVIETPDGNLSKGMRSLNGIHTQAFNKRHRRVGHLFQGRYKAILVDKESYLLEVCRYVVLNPIRARMVAKPEAWKWSSYGATAGRVKAHPSLTTDWVLGQFGRALTSARREYRKFVRAGMTAEPLWDSLRAQSLLGSDDFVDRLKDYLTGSKMIQEIPRGQRYLDRPDLDTLFPADLLSTKGKRDQRIVESVEQYGYTQKHFWGVRPTHYTFAVEVKNLSDSQPSPRSSSGRFFRSLLFNKFALFDCLNWATAHV